MSGESGQSWDSAESVGLRSWARPLAVNGGTHSRSGHAVLSETRHTLPSAPRAGNCSLSLAANCLLSCLSEQKLEGAGKDQATDGTSQEVKI